VEEEVLVAVDRVDLGKERISSEYIISGMKKFLRANLLLWFCFSISLANSFAQKTIPELWGQRVHDEAHALQQATVDQLEKSLKAYEDSTSNQIAILIIQSLDGDVLEEYSLRVAEKWKLGQKEKDNGVLLLISVDDHKMRIEVGHGLEGVLTDALCSRIIRNEIAPAFRRGEFDAGVVAGINGIIKAIGGEYKADDINSSNDLTITERIFIGLFLFVVLGIFTLIAAFVQAVQAGGCMLFLFHFMHFSLGLRLEQPLALAYSLFTLWECQF
jgi:uncharacterized protein